MINIFKMLSVIITFLPQYEIPVDSFKFVGSKCAFSHIILK